jgi:hypothetical protein
MPAWFDAVNPVFVEGVANRYVVDNPLEVFDIFPKVPTKKLTGYIAKYDKTAWFKIGTVADYKRVGATESIGDDYTISKQAYTVEEYAFHKDITQDDANEFDSPYQPLRDAVAFVINRIGRVMLQNLVDTYFATGIWTDHDYTAHQFDDVTSKVSDYDPVAQISSDMMAMQKTTGMKANRMVVMPDTNRALKLNTYITNRLKVTETKVVTDNLLASLFEVATYKEFSAINSGATDYLQKGTFWLGYTPNSPSVVEPSAGYQLTYTQGPNMVETRRIPMPMKNNALRIEAVIRSCPVKLATDLATYGHTAVGGHM